MAVELEIRGSVATVTLNRPEKLNALTEAMKVRLAEVFTQLRDDSEVRAVVLAGAGRGFCAGGDVQTMREQTPTSSQKRLASAHAVITTLCKLDKPVIAAVRGPVAGIGWSMAMACDLIVASDNTKFHQSFKRIGLLPDGGAIFFLRQVLGPAVAKELVYTARPLDAEAAKGYGLVNRIVPDAELERHVQDLAAELAEGPAMAFRLAKKLFRLVDIPALETFLDAEAWAQGLVLMTNDHKEGAAAFRDKRAPRFSGT